MKNATPSDTAINNIVKEIEVLVIFAKEFIKSGSAYAPNFLNENENLSRKFDKIIEQIEQVKTLGYISERQFIEIKSQFEIKDEALVETLSDISTSFLNPTKSGHIGDIVEGVFEQSSENIFIQRMYTLRKALEACLTKKEKAKKIITGLKQPVVWEHITILFNGSEIKIKQNDRSLGSYSLSDLNFPHSCPTINP